MNDELKAYDHQVTTTDFILNNPRCLITSDPGTGKTRSVLDAFAKRKGKMLVLAPLSILEAAWADDILKFQPDIKYGLAYAKNREKIFKDQQYNVVITNFEAVNFLVKNKHLLKGFDTICIDEFTAYKNRTSQRSKNLAKIIDSFKYRIAMSGTPNSNTILDLWHPTYIIDDGQRLGKRFFSFRNQVCTSKFNGFANEWIDKPDAEESVANVLKDIVIRYALNDCIDLPETSIRTIYTNLSTKTRKAYELLSEESVLYTTTGTINAVNAGARVKKLLQLITGAVYDQEGTVQLVHEERYALIIDLIKQRKHSLVAFNWKHERNHLIELAEKQNISYGVIDGDVNVKDRKSVVDRFQNGHLQVLFAHPQSAGHGLTLTKGTCTIWSSPTYNAEHFQQFNKRIHRAGQTKKTETILIAARDTWEEAVYKKLDTKMGRMENLLKVLCQLSSK